MIKGLLLYTKEDAKKNKWFIEHLMETAKKYGMDLVFSVFTDEFTATDKRDGTLYDFCINRTRYSCVNEFFEEKKIRCYNNFNTVQIANDKWETYRLCKELEIPVMETWQVTDSLAMNLEYPVVIKSKNGHGGNEVFWINNQEELQKLGWENESGYIAQSPVSTPGVDVRIYVLGDNIRIGVKRTSSKDFRSNFSLGGKVELFTPTSEQLEMIEELQKVIAADYAGFDFLLHNGSWVLNEIEDAVGARMLYSLVDFDIAEEWMQYICKDLQELYKCVEKMGK